MISILEAIDQQLPGLFFHYFPTGSLAEGLGKCLPISSVLATDYDLMLVPSQITVGKQLLGRVRLYVLAQI